MSVLLYGEKIEILWLRNDAIIITNMNRINQELHISFSVSIPLWFSHLDFIISQLHTFLGLMLGKG